MYPSPSSSDKRLMLNSTPYTLHIVALARTVRSVSHFSAAEADVADGRHVTQQIAAASGTAGETHGRVHTVTQSQPAYQLQPARLQTAAVV